MNGTGFGQVKLCTFEKVKGVGGEVNVFAWHWSQGSLAIVNPRHDAAGCHGFCSDGQSFTCRDVEP